MNATGLGKKRNAKRQILAVLVLVLVCVLPTHSVRAQVGVQAVVVTGDPIAQAISAVQTALQQFMNTIGLSTLGGAQSTATIGSANINAEATRIGNQGVIDNQRYTANIQEAMRRQADATMTDGSLYCATIAAGQAADLMDQATAGLTAQFEILQANRGKGAKADPTMIRREIFQEACKQGFLPANSFGNTGCTADPNYAGTFSTPATVTGTEDQPVQYPLPLSSHEKTLPDGVVTFPGATTNTNRAESEKAWVAAYMYCELMTPNDSKSVYANGNGAMTDSQQMDIMSDIVTGAMESDTDECLRIMVYHTACPAGTEDEAKSASGSSTCHQVQVDACHELKNTPTASPPGMGITGDVGNYLTNCDNDGLSKAMYDRIKANACNDLGYATNLAKSFGNALEAEKFMQGQCQDKKEVYKQKLKADYETLRGAREQLRMMKAYHLEDLRNPNSMGRPLGSQ